jgi:PST family polysaccharide transporter
MLFFLADYWNELIFGVNFKYSFVFKAFAFALPWYALSLVLVAIINGLGKFNKVIYITIIGNAIGLIVSILFVSQLQTMGALLSIILTPSLLFLVSFYFISKEISIVNSVRWRFFDFKIIKNLSHYFLIALVSGIIGSIVFLSVRKNIIANVGIQEAGYWEAITRISSYYLLFVSSILTIYFFPKLVESKNDQETKKVFSSYYKTIIPPIVIALIIIYFARFYIIKLLFTNAFLPVTSLFFWQLIGDFFKTAALILGFQFLAKKMTTAFIVAEIASLAVFYFLSIFLVHLFGIQGVVMAQAFDNLIYFLVLIVYFRKILF